MLVYQRVVPVHPLFAQDPCNVLEIHPLHLAGESVDSKLRRVREAIQEQKASGILLSRGRR